MGIPLSLFGHLISGWDAGAIQSVAAEMERQDKKWGEQEHDFSTWNEILVEEVGEVSEAILDYKFERGEGVPLDVYEDHYRDEVIQVAAVAIRMVANLDRQRKR